MAGYGSDAAYEAWLTEQGYTVPETAPSSTIQRQRASVYIDATYEARFPGERTSASQERAWPRSGATLFGSDLATSAIPQQVIDASYMAAYLSANSLLVLSVSTDPNQRVKRQKVDTIEREFFEPGGGSFAAPYARTNSLIDGMLYPLIGPMNAEPNVLVV
ncbi:DnaT-like ssDNA-binding protein [Mesorhizobium sp. Z1-4]|uniref:DnaT-like ssDNA-binding protein n=1 Tax=Mesorhizobium sp. Z1-4 TaxID=2448478 RepID=UPI000FD872F4|nr:DnaT-like ssDNA-binding protein [Mesorhizobium sp. Z1-4]